jgi:hypothetical protein
MLSDEKATLLKRILVATLAVLMIFGAGAWSGIAYGVRSEKAEAVKQGHARFIVLDEYGHSSFQWLDKGDVVPAPSK